eukprot:5185464-Pleurochrysis_carterae.AAC.3
MPPLSRFECEDADTARRARRVESFRLLCPILLWVVASGCASPCAEPASAASVGARKSRMLKAARQPKTPREQDRHLDWTIDFS